MILRSKKLCIFALLFLIHHQDGDASGFQIREQSALGQGNSFAGIAAGSHDANAIFFNGASMTLYDRNTLSSSASVIHFSGDYNNGNSSTISGSLIEGSGTFKHETSRVPAISAVYSWADNLKFGINVSAPWGLKTNYDHNWVGRYYAIQSELRSININPLLAFKVNNKFSYSIGIQAQYLEVEIDNAIDFGTLGFLNSVPGAIPASTNQDGFVSIKGDDWGFGWTAGFLFETSPTTKLGIAYRSKISYQLKGKADFRLDPQGIGATLSGATDAFINTDSFSRIETPEFITFGIRHDINKSWSIMSEFDFTRWSRVDQLVIQFENPSQSNNITNLKWDDTWFASFGIEYRPNDRLQLRGGIAYEEGASSNEFRSPRVPDADRYWFSLGGTYAINNHIKVHGAYSHLNLDDPTLVLSTSSEPNVSRGNLVGEYDVHANILAFGISFIL
ncbi:MAG: outer membrane protein transport protein [Gammaproteobacteria bacterium]|nr:outer membrane protein transport protein [Gammaproteobacteria bacterium]